MKIKSFVRILSKGLTGLLVAALAVPAGFAPAPAYAVIPDPVNLIVNGSFEDGTAAPIPQGWGKWVASGTPVYTLDNTQSIHGDKSVKIEAVETARGAIYQTININTLEREKTYKLSAWIKTDEVTAVDGAQVRIKINRTSPTYAFTQIVKGTQDWTEVTAYVKIPAADDITGINIEAFLNTGTGAAWFDNFSFILWTDPIPVEPPPPLPPSSNLVVNGGFEGEPATHANGGDIPEGWSLWYAAGTPQFKIDTDVFYYGKQSLRISAPSEAEVRGAVSSQVIPITAAMRGKTYKLRQWIKTDSVSSSNGARSRIQTLPSQNPPLSGSLLLYTPSVKDTTDWTLVELIFIVPENTEIQSIEVQSFLELGTGTAWFDGTALVPASTSQYERPDGERIVDDLKKLHPDNGHPRILATQDTFERIKEDLKTDPNVQRFYWDVLNVANAALSQPVTTYALSDETVRKLSSSGTMRAKLEPLIMVYKITGDEKYAFRAWQELEAVSKYPDWNENHFLDTAEMAGAVGLGYDWLYDYLTEEQRTLIRTALVEKGLDMARTAYDGSAKGDSNRKGFVTSSTNWNYVCNSGIAMGALAIADEEEELAAYILEQGLLSVERVLPLFGPDGAWAEGLGYWMYTVRYLVNYMASLESALGTNYGYYNIEGIDNTGYYPVYMSGPKGMYNYGNAGSGHVNSPELFFFAMMENDANLAGLRLQNMIQSNFVASIKDLLWFYPSNYSEQIALELDAMFRGAEKGTMRSGWDTNSTFIAFGGGRSTIAHQHMDTGNFIFDALGERWIDDLGLDNYDLPGFWEYATDGMRWHYYRNRTEGHNTLVFNPSLHAGQEADKTATITRFDANQPFAGIGVVDLSETYSPFVDELQRGFFLTENRRILVVQDEFKAKTTSDLWSFLQTKADIELLPDGRSALFKLNGKCLYIVVQSTAPDVELTVTSADNMDTSPVSTAPEKEKSRSQYKRLAINVKNVLNDTVTMVMIPLQAQDAIPTAIPQYGSIDSWNTEGPKLPSLSGIFVDGERLQNFNSNLYSYEVELPYGTTRVPVVTAKVDGDHDIEIELPPELPGQAKITLLTDVPTLLPITYYVTFKIANIPPIIGFAEGMSQLAVVDNINAGATLDGNTDTRWTGDSGAWVQYDLGSLQKVSGVAVSWFNGHRLQYSFKIQVSADGTEWNTVYDRYNSRTTADYETYPFEDVQARYVRIVSKGSSESANAVITEARILSRDEPDEVDPTPAEPIIVKEGNTTTVFMTGEVFEQMATQKGDVTIDAEVVLITFDKNAVKTISSIAADGNISVVIKEVDKNTLPAEIQSKVGDRPVYDFSVVAGNTQISEFGNGKTEISIPYTLKSGEKKNSIVVYHIDDSGKLITEKGKYDEASGTVKFAVKHF